MFENIINIFKKNKKREVLKQPNSKDKAKERLHLVLMQDRANVSADFLDLMRKEIIEVIKKYIDIDEKAMDVRLTTETNEDGVQGAPALYANIPIINIKEESKNPNKNKESKIFKEFSKINEIKESEEETEESKKDETKEDENKTRQLEEKVKDTTDEMSEDTSKQETDENPQMSNKEQPAKPIENIEKEKNEK